MLTIDTDLIYSRYINCNYKYDEQKNQKLKAERGICFDDVLNAINDRKILDILTHYNKDEYPNQQILIIEVREYVYLVPFLEEDDLLILKTVFPSRKFTKFYLGGKNNEPHEKTNTQS